MSLDKMIIIRNERKIAEIISDHENRLLVDFNPGITRNIRKKVLEIVADKSEIYSNRAGGDFKEMLAGEGFSMMHKSELPEKFREPEEKEITKEERMNARFIHESNLIERMDGISYDEILERLHKGNETGSVGAWKLAKLLGENGVEIKPEHVLHMQKMITEEQADYGFDLESRYCGKLRKIPVMVGQDLIGAPKQEDFNKFFADLKTGLEGIDPNELSSVLGFISKNHLEFEDMHPFADGNGRTGRLIVNYLLYLLRYPTMVFTNKDVQHYYSAFRGPQAVKEARMKKYFQKKYRGKRE